ncbi:MAG TPA: ornithine carbamoyltransferase [Abditibacteriaceae bacterium]|nr:ornithine carbamoyltransferase [Abditibacteriaceae bacterium]
MKHFLSINDLARDEANFLLAETARLKAELNEFPARQRETLAGKTLAMIFEKPSLRTRVSFDVAIHQLGGHPLYLSPEDIGLGRRESVADVARVLSRLCDGIMARVFKHETVAELARAATVPVINGLCDREHPCQALGDLVTLREHKGLEGCKLAYVGDGNNVCHSLMLLSAKLGVRFAAGVPEGYAPDPVMVTRAREDGEVEVTHDPRAAVAGADAVYTDVWTSMGQEDETARRLKAFPPYQVNAELLRYAAPDAIVLHCLPAHRGEEITDEVMESPQSVVFDQAENRLHAQKAVLVWLFSQ